MLFGEALRNVGGLFFASWRIFFCLFLGGMKKMFVLCFMNDTQTHTMKYTTTDKHAHQYETFTASEGPATIVASVDKEGAGWNWFVRVAYLKPDGITYIDDAQGREWSKPEARASFEAAASRLIAQIQMK